MTAKDIDKDKLERIFAKLGLKPVHREKHGNYNIFYGDGFSTAPHLMWKVRGETEVDNFPLGAFVTFWWVGKDDKLYFGRPLFMDLINLSQTVRINTARKDAIAHLTKKRKRTYDFAVAG